MFVIYCGGQQVQAQKHKNKCNRKMQQKEKKLQSQKIEANWKTMRIGKAASPKCSKLYKSSRPPEGVDQMGANAQRIMDVMI